MPGPRRAFAGPQGFSSAGGTGDTGRALSRERIQGLYQMGVIFLFLAMAAVKGAGARGCPANTPRQARARLRRAVRPVTRK